MLMIRNTLTQEVNDLDKDLQKSNKTLTDKNKSHQVSKPSFKDFFFCML